MNMHSIKKLNGFYFTFKFESKKKHKFNFTCLHIVQFIVKLVKNISLYIYIYIMIHEHLIDLSIKLYYIVFFT